MKISKFLLQSLLFTTFFLLLVLSSCKKETTQSSSTTPSPSLTVLEYRNALLGKYIVSGRGCMGADTLINIKAGAEENKIILAPFTYVTGKIEFEATIQGSNFTLTDFVDRPRDLKFSGTGNLKEKIMTIDFTISGFTNTLSDACQMKLTKQ
jgi:hypothetical protein